MTHTHNISYVHMVIKLVMAEPELPKCYYYHKFWKTRNKILSDIFKCSVLGIKMIDSFSTFIQTLIWSRQQWRTHCNWNTREKFLTKDGSLSFTVQKLTVQDQWPYQEPDENRTGIMEDHRVSQETETRNKLFRHIPTSLFIKPQWFNHKNCTLTA